ncbi:2-amino-4-hydroxy-6-hydroxymethyldihydropteridine diphosphokinase [Microbacterium sp. MEC084]|jgi:2-amino-4-hydroxy-6-hydroxymethyldihydropteridine diphosphokinase|uniref:2-amino-4-hydroxy-6- hydroxymethyldihydropteridine diphosphokinase n=1 Tax=Microbacterium sp. MEC084 TaxID=1963027 RepID=UPI0010702BE1|nr:2-amino-4-hydroxy-6-hydroxymethyldihydropteridine diphosphokinase [Microbacterium sp. MEC084]MCD1267796.1 2-amino-4-hydroxy-6-hydroxymethyldihydropteridine diphosphokinase [Microbacterium sp. MEC084]
MSRDLTRPLDGMPPVERREPVTAVVALGANLGDRAATIAQALAELRRLPLVEDVVASTPIESVALTLDGPDESEPAYLNAVALVRTRLDASVLLGLLHAIEARHGRERRERWGARTLDLDLIAYGELTSDDEKLKLPHPRAAERDFVLAPWLEVDPDAVLPGRGRVADLLRALREGEG